MGRSLEDDILSTANNFVSNFTEANLIKGNLDYSIESLELVDQFLEESGDFVFDDEEAVFNISSMGGCYVFDTARRNYGGEYRWVADSQQPVLIAGLPDFSVAIMAWDKVKGRLLNGVEDSIPFYISGYKEHIEKGMKEKGYHVTIV